MDAIGIDIGSTAAKVVVLGLNPQQFTIPTGWSSKEAALEIRRRLGQAGVKVDAPGNKVIATGYGRNSVDYATKRITEITCHGRGGLFLADGDCTVIDIGGQDTKVIRLENGAVADFLMNDKCAAGTGKFIEVMANRLDVTIDELFLLAAKGTAVPISSLCTVFAESEVISYIGKGSPREDIAAGVVGSVATKVVTMSSHQRLQQTVLITGGLSYNRFFAQVMEKQLRHPVKHFEDGQGRYAGALGAALIAQEQAE